MKLPTMLLPGWMLLASASTGHCDDSPVAYFHLDVGRPLDNALLPTHIPLSEGESFLYADFTNRSSEGVPLYLVNQSQKTLHLPTQDLDPYIKLEYRDPSGRWIRAQHHRDSGCGNSYFPTVLPPGHHFAFFGYAPESGTPATVRFRGIRSNSVVSNEGPGFFLERDVADAARDTLSLEAIPRSLVSALDPSFWGGSLYLPTRWYNGEFEACILLLSQFTENLRLREAIEKQLRGEAPDLGLEPEARKRIEAILAQPWPVSPDYDALSATCMEWLRRGGDKSGSNVAKSRGAVAWGVIGDLAQTALSHPDQTFPGSSLAEIYTIMNQRLAEIRTPREAGGVGMLLEHSPPEFSDLLETSSLLSALTAGIPHSAAKILGARKEFAAMAGQAVSGPLVSQMAVLRILANKPDSGIFVGGKDSPEESQLWQTCLANYPVQVVHILDRFGLLDSSYNPYHRSVHDALLPFLKAAAAGPTGSQGRFYDPHEIARVVEFVGQWKIEEDIPPFQQLLQHPAHEVSTIHTGSKRYEERRYSIRTAAKEALQRMNVAVDPGIVEEEETELPPSPSSADDPFR